MINPFSALRKSLPARLLLVFILTSVLITVLIIGILAGGFASHWRLGVRPHLEQYLAYINEDLGYPPDVEKAEALANRLPLNIYISGEGLNYSSTGTMLDLEDLEFHRRFRKDRHWKNRHEKDTYDDAAEGLSFGELDNRTVLKNVIGEYEIYFEIPHGDQAVEREGSVHKGVFFLLLILLISYLILRRMLRPIHDIKLGVQTMGKGQLNYRIPVKGRSDLSELSGSINNMASQIEAMLDAKRQLLLSVSHELRSPLTRARLATQMLEDSSNRERLLEDIQEMETLITEILETERMNSNHASLSRQDVNLELLVRSVMEEFQADQVDVQIEKLVGTFSLDEARIKLLLRNLVSNAIRHCHDEDLPVLVNLFRRDNKLTIQVIDHGPGIAPEHLDKVIEPFYRADPSRTRATGGFGLGLYLCKLIAEAHDGSLKINSALGEGTTVTVVLTNTPG